MNAAAVKFYGKFLPQLGFVRERHEPTPSPEAGARFSYVLFGRWQQAVGVFWITEDKNHKPKGTRIAFWAETRGDIRQ